MCWQQKDFRTQKGPVEKNGAFLGYRKGKCNANFSKKVSNVPSIFKEGNVL